MTYVRCKYCQGAIRTGDQYCMWCGERQERQERKDNDSLLPYVAIGVACAIMTSRCGNPPPEKPVEPSTPPAIEQKF